MKVTEYDTVTLSLEQDYSIIRIFVKGVAIWFMRQTERDFKQLGHQLNQPIFKIFELLKGDLNVYYLDKICGEGCIVNTWFTGQSPKYSSKDFGLK